MTRFTTKAGVVVHMPDSDSGLKRLIDFWRAVSLAGAKLKGINPKHKLVGARPARLNAGR